MSRGPACSQHSKAHVPDKRTLSGQCSPGLCLVGLNLLISLQPGFRVREIQSWVHTLLPPGLRLRCATYLSNGTNADRLLPPVHPGERSQVNLHAKATFQREREREIKKQTMNRNVL